MPEAKPGDTNMPMVLSLLDNDRSIFLVPEVKQRDTNMPEVFISIRQ